MSGGRDHDRNRRRSRPPIRREDLLPRDTDDDLPLQAKMLARISIGRMTPDDLRFYIAAGAMPAKDDPDAVNAIFAQGW